MLGLQAPSTFLPASRLDKHSPFFAKPGATSTKWPVSNCVPSTPATLPANPLSGFASLLTDFLKQPGSSRTWCNPELATGREYLAV